MSISHLPPIFHPGYFSPPNADANSDTESSPKGPSRLVFTPHSPSGGGAPPVLKLIGGSANGNGGAPPPSLYGGGSGTHVSAPPLYKGGANGTHASAPPMYKGGPNGTRASAPIPYKAGASGTGSAESSAPGNASGLGDPPPEPGTNSPHPDLWLPPAVPNSSDPHPGIHMRWDDKVKDYTIVSVYDKDKKKWQDLDPSEYKSTNSKFIGMPGGGNKIPPAPSSSKDYDVPPTGDRRIIMRYDAKSGKDIIVGVRVNGKPTYFDKRGAANAANAYSDNIFDGVPHKRPPPSIPTFGNSSAPGPSDQLGEPPPAPKDDSTHPDMWLPPSLNGKNHEGVIVRWDEKVKDYTVVASYDTKTSSWHWFDAKEYQDVNGKYLGKAGGGNRIPAEDKKAHPDYRVPSDGDHQIIMRYDPATGKDFIAGVVDHGKPNYFTTKGAADTVNYGYAKDIFNDKFPERPLRPPEKGEIPMWGDDSAHPNFVAPASNRSPDQKYLWAWNDEVKRYVAIGEEDSKGHYQTYTMGNYRTYNSGENGLRPGGQYENNPPKPFPPSSPFSSEGTDPNEKDTITIKVPSARDGNEGGEKTGKAVYRIDAATGKKVRVGIQVDGDSSNKYDPPRTIYFTDEQFKANNPGGTAKPIPEDLIKVYTSDSTYDEALEKAIKENSAAKKYYIGDGVGALIPSRLQYGDKLKPADIEKLKGFGVLDSSGKIKNK